jgi:DNA-binding NarL/FixJ family response regulator
MNRLTKRQHQVVLELVKGLPDKEIGRRLGLTAGTVRVMLHTIYQSVGVSNRVALATRYIDYKRTQENVQRNVAHN